MSQSSAQSVPDFEAGAARAESPPPPANAAPDAAATPPAAADSAAPSQAGAGDIVFTDSAALRVKQLIEEEQNDQLMLRVFISGGGCSGFQYGFTFDDERADDDTILQKMGVTVLVDPMSYQYLIGAEIDYRDNLEGSQFVIRNPNVTSTCGCGSSFSV